MDYYVIIHKDTGVIYGLSTFLPKDDDIPEDYISLSMEGTLPTSLSSWDSNSRTFVSVSASTGTLTKYQFLDRFTMNERLAIRAAAKVDPIVDDFMAMLDISQEVQLNNPLVYQGLSYLAYTGKLDSGRIDQILSGG